MSTKVHAVVDGLGNPLRVLLTPGNRNVICYAQQLLELFDLWGKYVIADKGYDSDRFVHWLEERGAIDVIPSRKTAKRPRDVDRHIYMKRHLVENLFLKFKHIVVLPPDMKSVPACSLRLPCLPLFSFGLLEFEDTL